jgi:hypothetical protein
VVLAVADQWAAQLTQLLQVEQLLKAQVAEQLVMVLQVAQVLEEQAVLTLLAVAVEVLVLLDKVES